MQTAKWVLRLSPQRGPSFKSLPFGANGSLRAKHTHTHPPHLTRISSCRVNYHGPAPMAVLHSDALAACKSGLWASCHQNPVSKDTRSRNPCIVPRPRMTRTQTWPSQCINPHPPRRRRALLRSHSARGRVQAGRSKVHAAAAAVRAHLRKPTVSASHAEAQNPASATQTDAFVPATFTRTTQYYKGTQRITLQGTLGTSPTASESVGGVLDTKTGTSDVRRVRPKH